MGAALGFVSNLGGFLGGQLGAASSSPTGPLAAGPLVAVVMAVVVAVVVAVAFPGEPFGWPSAEATLAPGGADPYRPSPRVILGVSPPRIEVLVLVMLSGAAAAIASQAGSDVFYRLLLDGSSAPIDLFATVSRLVAPVECVASLLVFGVALALAWSRARFAVSTLMGVAACAIGVFVLVEVAGVGARIAPIGVLGSLGEAVAESLFFPCAIGLVLTTTSSRGAGAAGAVHAFVVYGVAIVTGVLTGAGRGALAGVFAVVLAIATIASGVVLALVGPRFERPGGVERRLP
jgi:hypothetical protein